MDLTEFRAAHPGLYDRILENGANAERTRCADHIALAVAAGAPHLAESAVRSGYDVEDSLAGYRQHAERGDATAAQFTKKLASIRRGESAAVAPPAAVVATPVAVDKPSHGERKMSLEEAIMAHIVECKAEEAAKGKR